MSDPSSGHGLRPVPEPSPPRRGRASRSAGLVALARRFLAEGATAEPWADIWVALRHPDGRTICVPSAVLEQARGNLRGH